jgi:hypothetical protein
MDEARMIAHLMQARDEWERLINRLGSTRLGIGSVSGTWSVKDIVAHILGREQHLADRIVEIARGEPVRVCVTRASLDAFIGEFGYPDYDSPLLSTAAADDWMVQKYRTVPMEEVIADELHAFDALLAAVRLLPPQELAERDLHSRVLHVTADHYRLHGADIRRHFKRLLRQR